jgi:hypothetical protein
MPAAACLLAALALCLPAYAQDKPRSDAKKADDKKPAAKVDDKKVAKPAKKKAEYFNDPARAGPDLLVQGEYVGEDGKDKFGLQVVAEGEGRFSAWLFKGGLPGAGGESKTRVRLVGKSEAGKTRLDTPADVTRPDWHAVITGETAELTTGNLGPRVALKKVIRRSPTEGAAPPEGAIVLFDGTEKTLAEWVNPQLVEGKLLLCGTRTRRTFGDVKLHLEFRTPYCARSAGRSNSGVFVGEFYEIQIMDSFGIAPGGRGEKYECGAGYGVAAPRENVTYPALQWQTFDIEFRMPRFDEAGKKVAAARMTVIHNGVKVQDNLEFPAGTNGRPDAKKPAPILLQNHGSPTVFRNVWVVEIK